MEALDKVRLTAVIDVFDLLFDAVGPDPTDGVEERDSCWRDGIIAAGYPAPITADFPVVPWLIRVSDLCDSADPHGPTNLTAVVVASLTRRSDAEPSLIDRLRDSATQAMAVDEIPPLAGGYLLENDNRVLADPGCCGDLDDLDEWLTATFHDQSEPAILWTGHPWLLVSANLDVLSLTQTTETRATPERAVASVTRGALIAAVTTAERELSAFAATLRAACVPIVGEDAATVVTARLLGKPAGSLRPFTA